MEQICTGLYFKKKTLEENFDVIFMKFQYMFEIGPWQVKIMSSGKI